MYGPPAGTSSREHTFARLELLPIAPVTFSGFVDPARIDTLLTALSSLGMSWTVEYEHRDGTEQIFRSEHSWHAPDTQWIRPGSRPYGPAMEYEESPEIQPEFLGWENGTGLLGMDDPAVVDAAFERGEQHVGVTVIGLALNHPDPDTILSRVARALRATDPELQRQGTVALAHVARLHRTVNQECLDLVRARPRGNEADDDLWTFIPRRKLPWWLWRHQLPGHLKWYLFERWRLWLPPYR